ncbi:MAG: ABC transporter permease [Terriglobales bacterium]
MLTSFSHFAAGTRRFRPEGVLTFAVILPASRYATPAQRYRFYDELLGRLRGLPGVVSAAALTTTPYSNDGGDWVEYEDASAPATRHNGIVQNVSPRFFAALHVSLLSGRGFTAADNASAPPIAVVSRTLARLRWPGRNAVGQRIRVGKQGAWLTVVGVAADAEYEWTNHGALPSIYRPLAQAAPADSLIAVRSRVAPVSLAASIRQQAAKLDPQLPLLGMHSLQEDIAFGLAPIYLLGYMMSALGIVALVLALAGLYGVAAYSAQRRLRELGVRAVCGAQPPQLMRQMVSRALRAVCAGLVLGGLGAVLFEHAAAGFVPAHRAALRDPMAVLREE